MRGYSEYKACDISWIGEIPEHWKVKRLGSAFIENRTLNSSLEITEAYKFNYGALIRKDEDVNPTEMTDTYCKYTCLNVNDIVLNGLNLNYDFVSQRVAKAYARGIITSAYLTLTPRDGINSNYYLYLLKSMDSMKLFHGMGTGIRLTLSFNEIKKQQILFPPIEEQQHIVSFLDEKTAKIDEYIDKKNKEIEALKEWKKALIAHVVTKGLNIKAKMKKFKSLLSDETPSHWKIVRNKNIFESHYEAVSSRKNIPLLSLTTEGVILRDVSTGKGKFPKDFDMYNVVYPNNIIFCLFDLDETPRTVGLCYNYGMITNAYTTFKIKDIVLPEYITNYYLAVDNIKALRPYYSGLRKVVQSNRFNSIQIPIPPIEEQQEIVEYIDAATTKADKMIVELTNHVESMKEYKQRLIADVVTGKINVQP